MRLVDIRNNIKKECNSCVVIIKYGNFYRVFDDDCYIIGGLTGYKIINKRLGFPITEYNRIINLLNVNSINYIVYNGLKRLSDDNNYYCLDYYKKIYYKKGLLNILFDYDIKMILK